MINVLRQFGNMPVTATTIGSLYPSLAEKNKKVRSQEKHDEIILSNALVCATTQAKGLWKIMSGIKAYFNIRFEKEAYHHQNDLDYLKTRKHYHYN